MAELAPPINEILGFLSKHSPDALQELSQKYPDKTELFKLGEHLGDEKEELEIRAEIALVGLKKAIKKCDENNPKFQKKLRRANTLQFIGQVVTACAGASVFGILALDFKKPIQYTVGTLALLGSIVTLFSQYLGTTLHPAAGSLFDQYKSLIDDQLIASQIYQELLVWKRIGFKGDDRSDLIAQANSVLMRISKTIRLAS